MKRATALALTAVLASVPLAACSKASTTSSGSAKTLVVDNAFDLKTIDPARSFEFTGVFLDRQIYETVLTFAGKDVKTIKPGICSYTISPDAKTVTLTMDGTHTFSDGTPVTADDIVFSLQRVQGIAGNPSFLLDGVTVTKKDDKTVVLTSKTPNPQLPYILPNPSLGIVNSKAVKAAGGGIDKNDNAEEAINKASVGSGPYMIESYDVQSKVVLKANPHFGGTKPAYGRVVVENVDAPTQKVNVQAGSAQLALNLGPDQVKGLDTAKTQVVPGESSTTIFLWFNMTPAFGKTVSNPTFVQAMRQAIDYKALLSIAGAGSKQPGGMVPVNFLGAVEADPANSTNQAKAKELLAASGYKGEEISVLFSSDVALGGVKLQNIAETIQAQVKPLGINIKLNPQPSSTSLAAFRGGKQQAGLAYWGADYPDPADYLVFAPGQSLGKRAAWTPAASPASDAAAKKAADAIGEKARAEAYQAFQKQLNVDGPFIPLFQPASNLVAASSLKNVVPNTIWTTELANIQ